MATISFTNSEGLTTSIATIELDSIVTNLNAYNSYFTASQNNLVYIRLAEGHLLLLDIGNNTNLKLFETFTFSYASDNVWQLKLTHNTSATEFTINDALLSVGFSGVVPIVSLESVFMKHYSQNITSLTSYSKTESDAR